MVSFSVQNGTIPRVFWQMMANKGEFLDSERKVLKASRDYLKYLYSEDIYDLKFTKNFTEEIEFIQ